MSAKPEIIVIESVVYADGTDQVPDPLPSQAENMILITITSLCIGLTFMALNMHAAIFLFAFTCKHQKVVQVGVIRMSQPEFLLLLVEYRRRRTVDRRWMDEGSHQKFK